MKINNGELAIFPTDTVYGLGALILDEKGQKRIYEIKKRDKNKRLACLCASIKQAADIAIVTPDAKKLMSLYWPGALTIILMCKKQLGTLTTSDTIGIRVPNHKLALEILEENGPMATTSVNLSGESPLNDPVKIKEAFGNLVDYIITEEKGSYLDVSSTVIDMTKKPYQVYREGTISKKEIFSKLGIE